MIWDIVLHLLIRVSLHINCYSSMSLLHSLHAILHTYITCIPHSLNVTTIYKLVWVLRIILIEINVAIFMWIWTFLQPTKLKDAADKTVVRVSLPTSLRRAMVQKFADFDEYSLGEILFSLFAATFENLHKIKQNIFAILTANYSKVLNQLDFCAVSIYFWFINSQRDQCHQ